MAKKKTKKDRFIESRENANSPGERTNNCSLPAAGDNDLPVGPVRDRLAKAFPDDRIGLVWQYLLYLAMPARERQEGMRTKAELCERWGVGYDVLYRIGRDAAFIKELQGLCKMVAGFDEYGELVDCIKMAAKQGDVPAMKLWAEIIEFYKRRYFGDKDAPRQTPQIIDESRTLIINSDRELVEVMDALDTVQRIRRSRQIGEADSEGGE